MLNIFSAVKNQLVLSANLTNITSSIKAWQDSIWNAGTPFFDVTAPNMEEVNMLHERMGNWRIAFSSCELRVIIDTLLKTNNYYYDHKGIHALGKAEYVALHKTTNGEVTPYMHTVLLRPDSENYHIYPLFVRNGRACIGSEPVGAGTIVKFTAHDSSLLTTSPVDNFAEIKKLKG